MEERSVPQSRKKTIPKKSKTLTFKRQFNPQYKGDKGSINKQPSQTVPDMSLTVKTLLKNHSRGIHSDIKHYTPEYFDTEIPVLDDLTDVAQYKEDLNNQKKDLHNQIIKEAKDKKQSILDKKAAAIEDLKKAAPLPKEEKNAPTSTEQTI